MKNNIITLTLKAATFALLVCGWSSAQTYVQLQINQPAQLLAHAGTDQTICNGDSALLGASPAASGGSPAYHYQWNSGSSISSTNTANPKGFPSQNAQYFLTVTDARGCSASDTVSITVDTCTAISPNLGLLAFSVFPNPSDGRFSIRVDENLKDEAEVRVYNAAGALIFSKTETHPSLIPVEIPLAAKGIYFIELRSGDKAARRRILIQ